MDDALRRLAEALPAWMSPTVERHRDGAVIISEMLVNLRLFPTGEVELTVGPMGNPLGPTSFRTNDRALQATGSVDEFVELARKIDALFTPTESAT